MINKNIAKMICFGIACGIQSANAGMMNDRDVVLAAVQQNGYALEYADDSLQRDRDIVLAAVQQNGDALRYANASLRRDKDFVLAAVQQNHEAFTHSHPALHIDVEIVAAAISGGSTTRAYALMNDIFATCTDCMGCWSILNEYLNAEQMDIVQQSENWSNFMDRLNKEKILAKRVLHEKLNSADLRMRLMSFLISAPKAQLA